jgi:hypothetical protein
VTIANRVSRGEGGHDANIRDGHQPWRTDGRASRGPPALDNRSHQRAPDFVLEIAPNADPDTREPSAVTGSPALDADLPISPNPLEFDHSSGVILIAFVHPQRCGDRGLNPLDSADHGGERMKSFNIVLVCTNEQRDRPYPPQSTTPRCPASTVASSNCWHLHAARNHYCRSRAAARS